jgi:hypothetical protein
MSFNLELDETTRDLKLSQGKNLALIFSPENVAQQVECRLRTVKGEWFLDYRLGIPYFTNILIKTRDKNRVDIIFKNEILKLAEVDKITQFESEIEKTNRVYKINKLVIKLLNGEETTVTGV